MIKAPDPSRAIAQNPAFATKAAAVAGRNRVSVRRSRPRVSKVSVQGVVRTVLALWCIKIAVVAARGQSEQEQMVARLEAVAPIAAPLAAPDPLTRNALALRYRVVDWMRSVERVF